MNRDDIIRMTEQERRALFFKVTGQVYSLSPMGVYSAFCKGLEAGAAAEREACAKALEDIEPSPNPIINMTIRLTADAIRARGQV